MAYPILVISGNEIVSRFKIQEAIDVVEEALANHEKGTDILPDKLIFQVPGGISACMASMLPDLEVLAMKLGQGREENPKRDLPNIISPDLTLRSGHRQTSGTFGRLLGDRTEDRGLSGDRGETSGPIRCQDPGYPGGWISGPARLEGSCPSP